MERITEGRYAGLYSLEENFIVTPDGYKKVDKVEEQVVQITEKGESKSFKCEGIYTFPISRPNKKNLNERIYTSKLWEKVIKEKQADNSYGLIDHPEGDGSFKDAFCVWRNVHFSPDRKLVLADAYLFGDHGKQVKAALEAGGKVGLSTVGYGDFKDDDSTIDENTYKLERVADFVLNPSYEVFGELSDQKEAVHTGEIVQLDHGVEAKVISVNGNKNVIKTSNGKTYTVDTKELEKGIVVEFKEQETPLQEKKVILMKKKNSVQSLEEKNFRLNIGNLIKEAEAKEKLVDKLEAFSEILDYFDEGMMAPDLQETIENRMKEIDTEIKQFAEKGTKLDEVTTSLINSNKEREDIAEELKKIKEENSLLSEQVDALAELSDSLKVYANKAKEMYEFQKAKSNGMVSATQYHEFVVAYEELEEKLSTLKEELRSLKKENKRLKKKTEDMGPFGPSPDDTIVYDADNVQDTDVVYDDDVEVPMDGDDEDMMEYDAPDVDPDIAYQPESSKKIRPEILEYYEDLEERNPRVVKIKQDILRCRTLMEAQKTYLRLKSLVQEGTAQVPYTRHVKRQEETELHQGQKLPKRAGWL